MNKAKRSKRFLRGLVMIMTFSVMGFSGTGLLNGGARAETQAIFCQIGYSAKTMADIDSRDLQAAFKIWTQELAGQYGFYLKTILYKSTERFVDDFQAKKIDFAVITSMEFLDVAKILKVKPVLTQYRNGRSFVKFLILADADAVKQGIAGLKDKKLSVLRNNDLGTVFLDTYLMKAGQPRSTSFVSAVQERNKESQAILDVFFGRSDMCVVSESAFTTMKEMNPQIQRKLRVVAESPELIVSVGFFRPDWPEEYKQRAIEAMKSEYFRRHERGKQIMLLFNIEKIDVVSDDQLENTRNLLADYDRLKRKK